MFRLSKVLLVAESGLAAGRGARRVLFDGCSWWFLVFGVVLGGDYFDNGGGCRVDVFSVEVLVRTFLAPKGNVGSSSSAIVGNIPVGGEIQCLEGIRKRHDGRWSRDPPPRPKRSVADHDDAMEQLLLLCNNLIVENEHDH